jgi:hypothetical protein
VYMTQGRSQLSTVVNGRSRREGEQCDAAHIAHATGKSDRSRRNRVRFSIQLKGSGNREEAMSSTSTEHVGKSARYHKASQSTRRATSLPCLTAWISMTYEEERVRLTACSHAN